jgi:hypothetical protein
MTAAGMVLFPPPYQIAEESLQSLENKMWYTVVFLIYFRLPTYQNGDENP